SPTSPTRSPAPGCAITTIAGRPPSHCGVVNWTECLSAIVHSPFRCFSTGFGVRALDAFAGDQPLEDAVESRRIDVGDEIGGELGVGGRPVEGRDGDAELGDAGLEGAVLRARWSRRSRRELYHDLDRPG